jgi:hypothetical protein
MSQLVAAICFLHNVCIADYKTHTCPNDPCLCDVCDGGGFAGPSFLPPQPKAPGHHTSGEYEWKEQWSK